MFRRLIEFAWYLDDLLTGSILKWVNESYNNHELNETGWILKVEWLNKSSENLELKELFRIIWSVAVCCSVLQCVAVCCSVLQRFSVCCSVLHCVAVRCSMLQIWIWLMTHWVCVIPMTRWICCFKSTCWGTHWVREIYMTHWLVMFRRLAEVVIFRWLVEWLAEFVNFLMTHWLVMFVIFRWLVEWLAEFVNVLWLIDWWCLDGSSRLWFSYDSLSLWFLDKANCTMRHVSTQHNETSIYTTQHNETSINTTPWVLQMADALAHGHKESMWCDSWCCVDASLIVLCCVNGCLIDWLSHSDGSCTGSWCCVDECRVTPSHVWHDSSSVVTWSSHSHVSIECPMTRSNVCDMTYQSLHHMCDMTHHQ